MLVESISIYNVNRHRHYKMFVSLCERWMNDENNNDGDESFLTAIFCWVSKHDICEGTETMT